MSKQTLTHLSRARLLLLILLLLACGERVRGGERDFAEVDTDRQVLLDRVVQQTGGQRRGEGSVGKNQ
jgi:hypothetical protein